MCSTGQPLLVEASDTQDQEGGYQQQVITQVGSAEQAFQERFKVRLYGQVLKQG